MIIFLLVVGYIALYLEFFLPGAIMGIIGALLIIGSVWEFAVHYSSIWLLTIYVVLVIISLYFLIKCAMWQISRQKTYGIFSSHSQEGYQAIFWDVKLVGKEATAVTDLKPGGFVAIDDKQLAAVSQSGYLSKGEAVVITGGEGETLYVRKK